MPIRLSPHYIGAGGVPTTKTAGIQEFNRLSNSAMYHGNSRKVWFVLKKSAQGHYVVYIYAEKPKTRRGIIKTKKVLIPPRTYIGTPIPGGIWEYEQG
ncbi:MAG: hypothetical protein PHW62_00960 [Candidatus Ratteibacteria bacterium]|nr:hypothetical protein [Candidatus Ratteibacteria bacterium]